MSQTLKPPPLAASPTPCWPCPSPRFNSPLLQPKSLPSPFACRVLAAALGDLASRGEMGERRVTTRCLNPKAVALGRLYGEFDPASHEWTDGVLAKAFR